jgi:adenosylcobinamide-GDP ribazoletransferase
MSERAVADTTGGTRPAAELLAAIGFLTRVPLAAARTTERRTGAAAFGLVGAGLGAIAAVPVLLIGASHPLVAAFLALGILTILDGALHLDGLADTVDALAAPADRAEAARTDPRLGAAGAVAIVLVLGIDCASLAEIATRWPTAASAAVVIATTASRAAVPLWAVAVSRFRTMARGRLGAWFAASTSPVQATVAVLTAATFTLLAMEVAGPLVAIGAVTGSVIAVLLGAAVVKIRHGLDGDGYGALIELTVAAILVSTAVLG